MSGAEFRKLTPAEREKWQREKDGERLQRFLNRLLAETDKLAEKKGCKDWQRYAWWRMIVPGAPAGATFGPSNLTDEQKDILDLMIHRDALRSALKNGRIEDALMRMYDVGRYAELVGINPFRRARKAQGENRKGQTKADPEEVRRAYETQKLRSTNQSETQMRKAVARRFGITKRTVDSYLEKSGNN